MKAHLKDKLHDLLAFLKTNSHKIIMDGDTHPTSYHRLQGEVKARYDASPDYYQGRPITPQNLLKEMDQAGVDMALCWQNPAALIYGQDVEQNFEALWQANLDIFDISRQHPQRFFAAGWTDPKALGLQGALRLTDRLIDELGFSIVKMNPAQNRFPIDSAEVAQVVDRIVEKGAIPAFHYGGDTPFTPAEGLEKIARRHPQVPVVGVHMGGGGSHYVEGDTLYLKTRELGLRQTNLFFILSAKRDTHIESDLISYQLAGGVHRRQIACGSDAPYGKPSWNYGGYRAMFKALRDGAHHPDPRLQQLPDLFSEADVQNYMGGNMAAFIIQTLERLLNRG